MIPIPVPDFPV